MNEPIHNNKINRVLLKPRFKLELDKSKKAVLEKFKKDINKKDCKYCSKISDNHIFIDVPKEEAHFWSPQLQIEVVSGENDKTIVKGVLGPKPQIWTFFMFLHFATAVAFLVFLVIFYVNWSLGKEHQIDKYMIIGLPVFWILLYFFGQSGKKLGYKQMVELDNFMMEVLEK